MMIANICKESYGYSAKTTIPIFKNNQETALFFDEEIYCTPNNQQSFDNLLNFLSSDIDFDKFLIDIANEVAKICF